MATASKYVNTNATFQNRTEMNNNFANLSANMLECQFAIEVPDSGPDIIRGVITDSSRNALRIAMKSEVDLKLTDSSATSRILGRVSASTGVVEQLTAAQVRTLLNVADGANDYTHPNHSGDVTSVADGVQTIANSAVETAKIANSAVTFAKMQNATGPVVLGRQTATSGEVSALSMATLKTMLDTDFMVQGTNSRRTMNPNDADMNSYVQSGFFRVANTAPNNFLSATSYGIHVQDPLSDVYAWQMMKSQTNNDDYYLRFNNLGTWRTPVKLWHDGNLTPANYVPVTRTVSAGTGLTGGGALSANITLNADFGTAAGTIAQGNDSRINNGQTAHGWGDHASAGYLTGLGSTLTSGRIPKATGASALADGIMQDDGSKLVVNGSAELKVGAVAATLDFYSGLTTSNIAGIRFYDGTDTQKNNIFSRASGELVMGVGAVDNILQLTSTRFTNTVEMRINGNTGIGGVPVTGQALTVAGKIVAAASTDDLVIEGRTSSQGPAKIYADWLAIGAKVSGALSMNDSLSITTASATFGVNLAVRVEKSLRIGLSDPTGWTRTVVSSKLTISGTTAEAAYENTVALPTGWTAENTAIIDFAVGINNGAGGNDWVRTHSSTTRIVIGEQNDDITFYSEEYSRPYFIIIEKLN